MITPRRGLHSLLQSQWPTNLFTLTIDPLVRNDSYWYVNIAQHGYHYSSHHISSVGFFPLYPIVLRAFMLPGLDPYVAGAIISTLFLVLSMVALAHWIQARGFASAGPLVAGLMLTYPFAFFLVADYAESLYLFLALTTFILFDGSPGRPGRRRQAAAGAFVFLATLARPTGFVIAPCLLVLWWRRPDRRLRDLAPLLGSPLALGLFTAYQWWAFGTPLAYVNAKALPPWSASLHQAIADLMLHGRPGLPPWFLAFNLCIAALFVGATPLVYRRFGPGYALFGILVVLFSLSGSLPGLQRYVAVIFPVFAAVAVAVPRMVLVGSMVTALYIQAFFFSLWVGGYGVF